MLFLSKQVEMLYQRYFLRMNQNNMTHMLLLLLIVAISLIAVQGHCVYIVQQLITEHALINAAAMLLSRTVVPNR